jgi:Ca2+-binding RTX toxin-like protein
MKIFGIVFLILTLAIIFVSITLIEQTISASTIGNQAFMQTPNGTIIRCASNVLITPGICVGTNENDTVVDPLHFGTVFGFKGDDKFKGLLGSETVFGGSGNDAIQGGNGSSTLFGNNGNDVLLGGLGPNILFGGGVSMLYGGNGDDQLVGAFDHEVMTGGPGHDAFVCKGSEDLLMDFDPTEDTKQGNCVLF